jgi:HK97 family phage major capsid protein
MTIDAWETYFVEKVVEAIAVWKENEIINGLGEGSNHVTGILTQTPQYALTKDVLSYSDLLDFEGNLPAKKDGAKWYMSKKTFFNTFKNILDDNGNPVASLNAGTNGKIVANILGREVVYIDEYIKNHNGSGTTAGTITAFMFDFKDYVFNENYNLGIKRRENWDNENKELKAVFACDGKPLFTDSLIVLKRATDVA